MVPLIPIFSQLWRYAFLRNILLACLAAAVLLPLYNLLYLTPSYHRLLTEFHEEESLRVAAHLARMLEPSMVSPTEAVLSMTFMQMVAELKADFRIDVLRLSDPDGMIVYSTRGNEKEAAVVSTPFLPLLNQGERISQRVRQTGTGRASVQPRELLRVYAPIMQQRILWGIWIIDYDITRPTKTLAKLLRQSNIIMAAGAFIVMTVVMATLLKTVDALTAHRKIDKALQQANADLEKRIAERTNDLIHSNQELQMEILEREQAERALLDNLRFMNTLQDTIPNPVFFKDDQGAFLGSNAAYAQIIGQSKEALVGRNLVALADNPFSEAAESFHQQDLDLIHHPGIRTEQQQIHCADGITRDYLVFKAVFRDAEGHVAGLVGNMLDISALKHAEKQLQESKYLFDAFMRHLPGPAFIKDLDGRYIFVNQAFAQISGADGLLQLCISDEQVWDSETALRLKANDEKVRRSQSAVNSVDVVRMADGRERQLLTTRFPIFKGSRPSAIGGVSIDITERTLAEHQSRQLALQLQQSQKMEALGTLAGGIAHDFNNLLASIIGYTEIAVAEIQKDSPVHHYLRRVLEASGRARSLVKQILTFSRQGESEPRPVQIKSIIKEVFKLLRSSLPVSIEIEQDIRSEAAVMADPIQIHQVMMNLCTNAGFAMRDKGGRLTVTLEDRVMALGEPSEMNHPAAGTYVQLTVADTGPGIAPEHVERIFDPFFTTKPKGEGTGLGLSVVHGIVTALGGRITVMSSPGQGARFDVYLPAIVEEPTIEKTLSRNLPVGSEKILYIDDEVFQTDMFKSMLGLLGYQVQACNRSREALRRFEKDPQAFDLVITDMIMPEMSGDELARQMLALRADLPIILCTGYGEQVTEAKVKEMGIKALALKPLVMEELAELIRAVLDRQPPDRVDE